MTDKNIENLIKVATIRAAIAQNELAPIDAEISSLEKQLKEILVPVGGPPCEGGGFVASVRHDQWREQSRQSLSLAVAVARESAWPLRNAAAKHYARVKILEELRDRQNEERRAKQTVQSLNSDYS